jgi:hypothetical protein
MEETRRKDEYMLSAFSISVAKITLKWTGNNEEILWKGRTKAYLCFGGGISSQNCSKMEVWW